MAPTVHSFSADFEPLGLVAQHPETYPGLLESSAPSGPAAGGARFDILPIASGEVLRLASDGQLSGPHAAGASGFLAALESWWAALYTPPSEASLPFSGGWLVYLAYEVAMEIEPRLVLPRSDDSTAALAIRTPAAWIRDRQSGTAWLVAEPGCEALLDRFARDVQSLGAWRLVGAGAIPRYRGGGSGAIRDGGRPRARISSPRETSTRQTCRVAGRDAPATRSIRRRSTGACATANPGPFAALLRDGDFAVISSSPERLVSVQGDRVATRPIAGTRPRGASPERDAALIESLLANEKERAEHVMLIDLERNDLGKVCAGGSVQRR